MPNSNAGTDSNTVADAHAHTDTDPHAYAYAYAYAYADPYANSIQLAASDCRRRDQHPLPVQRDH